MSTEERLLRRLHPQGECLVYSGYRLPSGYGYIWVTGDRQRRAHRVMWELHNGPIPEGLVVMHTCDNPPCCRLEHLRLGTQAENNLDRDAKGRTVRAKDPGAWARKVAHCKQGHPFDNANTYITPVGGRSCRRCRAAATARYAAKKRQWPDTAEDAA